MECDCITLRTNQTYVTSISQLSSHGWDNVSWQISTTTVRELYQVRIFNKFTRTFFFLHYIFFRLFQTSYALAAFSQYIPLMPIQSLE